jgi:hypothetical protein
MKLLDALRRARSLWLQAWPLWSVRVSAIGAIITAFAAAAPDTLLQVWNSLPDELKGVLPAGFASIIPTLLFAATIVVRLIPQKAVAEKQGVLKSTSGKVKSKPAGIAAGIATMIAAVIAVEGGYTNHDADPGGETNMGITKSVAVANGYAGPMRTLPREVAESIYYDRYLVQPGYAALVPTDAAVTEELFDTTVNMGAGRPSRWFQRSINASCGTRLTIDGRVGQGTIAAYKACQGTIGAAKLCVLTLDRLDAQQRAEYEWLVRRNPDLRVFLRGWVANRIGNVDRARCRVRAV